MNLSYQMKAARKASYLLAASNSQTRNTILKAFRDALDSSRDEIIIANNTDLEHAGNTGLANALCKRLVLDNKKIDALLNGIDDLIKIPDPLSIVDMKRALDDGLILSRKSVPIGVIGVIFESRPDALVQISCLCIKSGNVVVLKGGSEASNTNRTLFDILHSAIGTVGPDFSDCINLVETREEIKQLLAMDEYIDLMIPRGSNDLVRYIKNNTRIPVLGHADGICHMYIDRSADPDMSVKLVYDAKCQYPAVCNAIETLLVHRDCARTQLPRICSALAGVRLKGDKAACEIYAMENASEKDWSTEYNDLILSIRIVESLEKAVEHINHYGSHHTDAIVCNDTLAAEYFLLNVDSASVFHNCSTRFADGFRYGFGAEVGISTNKIHARGPVGIEGLTIYKYILNGSGQAVAPYADGRKIFIHKDLV